MDEFSDLGYETTNRACSQSIVRVRIVSYFKYFFKQFGITRSPFLPGSRPTWVHFPTSVNVELLPLKMDEFLDLGFETTYRACSQSIKMVLMVSNFK